MSHFNVMVISTDEPTPEVLEEMLLPFHEFECTGIERYIEDVDQTAEVQAKIDSSGLKEGLSDYGLIDRIVSDEREVDRGGAHKYGYAVVQGDKLIKAVDRTNPNRKWDWYTVGGRWKDSFLRKDGKFADIVKVSDLDIERMRNEEGELAGLDHDKFNHVIAGREVPSFPALREKHGIDKAREIYWADPVIKDLQASKLFGFMMRIEPYLVDRATFVQSARGGAVGAYSVLKDGQWIAQGEMGWFGMSNDEHSEEDWNGKVAALIDSLSPDHWLTMVDCHI